MTVLTNPLFAPVELLADSGDRRRGGTARPRHVYPTFEHVTGGARIRKTIRLDDSHRRLSLRIDV
jgi:hypothetical protein